jgi:hypothetical protein
VNVAINAAGMERSGILVRVHGIVYARQGRDLWGDPPSPSSCGLWRDREVTIDGMAIGDEPEQVSNQSDASWYFVLPEIIGRPVNTAGLPIGAAIQSLFSMNGL